MPKSGEVGTPKWVSKQLKKKGLEKLQFYCQFCEKQCRDANGFKLHVTSPSHAARQQRLTESGAIAKWSKQFESDFLYTLRSFPRGQVLANKVYNEQIRDKNHIHLNATRWRSLHGFVRHLNEKQLVDIYPESAELLIALKERPKSREDEGAVRRADAQRVHASIIEAQLARAQHEDSAQGKDSAQPAGVPNKTIPSELNADVTSQPAETAESQDSVGADTGSAKADSSSAQADSGAEASSCPPKRTKITFSFKPARK